MLNENVQWCTDLAIVPDGFSERHLDSYCACVSVSGLSSRAVEWSHKLCESYTDPASVHIAPSSASYCALHFLSFFIVMLGSFMCAGKQCAHLVLVHGCSCR